MFVPVPTWEVTALIVHVPRSVLCGLPEADLDDKGYPRSAAKTIGHWSGPATSFFGDHNASAQRLFSITNSCKTGTSPHLAGEKRS